MLVVMQMQVAVAEIVVQVVGATVVAAAAEAVVAEAEAALQVVVEVEVVVAVEVIRETIPVILANRNRCAYGQKYPVIQESFVLLFRQVNASIIRSLLLQNITFKKKNKTIYLVDFR